MFSFFLAGHFIDSLCMIIQTNFTVKLIMFKAIIITVFFNNQILHKYACIVVKPPNFETPLEIQNNLIFIILFQIIKL